MPSPAIRRRRRLGAGQAPAVPPRREARHVLVHGRRPARSSRSGGRAPAARRRPRGSWPRPPPSSSGTAMASSPASRTASKPSCTQVPSRSWSAACSARTGPIARAARRAALAVGGLLRVRHGRTVRRSAARPPSPRIWTQPVRVLDLSDGCAMRRCADYGNYCPISLGTNVLADRWTPHHRAGAPHRATPGSTTSPGACPASPARCSCSRLKHLERKGVVEALAGAVGPGQRVPPHPGRQGPRPDRRRPRQLGRRSGSSTSSTPRRRRRHTLHVVDAPAGRRRAAAAGARVVVQFDHTAPDATTHLAGARPRRGVGLHAAPRLRRSTSSSAAATQRARRGVQRATAELGRATWPPATSWIDAPPRLAKALPAGSLWEPVRPRRRGPAGPQFVTAATASSTAS